LKDSEYPIVFDTPNKLRLESEIWIGLPDWSAGRAEQVLTKSSKTMSSAFLEFEVLLLSWAFLILGIICRCL
jgi:hypothetical protein